MWGCAQKHPVLISDPRSHCQQPRKTRGQGAVYSWSAFLQSFSNKNNTWPPKNSELWHFRWRCWDVEATSGEDEAIIFWDIFFWLKSGLYKNCCCLGKNSPCFKWTRTACFWICRIEDCGSQEHAFFGEDVSNRELLDITKPGFCEKMVLKNDENMSLLQQAGESDFAEKKMFRRWFSWYNTIATGFWGLLLISRFTSEDALGNAISWGCWISSRVKIAKSGNPVKWYPVKWYPAMTGI